LTKNPHKTALVGDGQENTAGCAILAVLLGQTAGVSFRELINHAAVKINLTGIYFNDTELRRAAKRRSPHNRRLTGKPLNY
jgi:hypothetical protein